MKFLVIKLLVFICLGASIGCVPAGYVMPGQTKFYESKAEGIKNLEVNPGWIDKSFKLGLFKTSSMPKDEVYLVVATYMSAAMGKDGVLINVDGTKTTLSAVDQLSDTDEFHYFHKRFRMKLDMVQKMVQGKEVHVKVSSVGQSYVEGEFSKGGSMSAKEGFTKFLSELNKLTDVATVSK